MRNIDIINDGTVIDHITAGCSRKIAELIASNEEVVIIGINLVSTKFGKKDILKYPNKKLTNREKDLIAILSPTATVSLIKNSSVILKEKLVTPDFIEGILVCPNPRCITNYEKIDTKFYTTPFQCFYCERLVDLAN